MKTLLPAMLASLAMVAPAAAADRDLLKPEAAFRLTAQLATPGEILVRYEVARGYYLYRDKLKFSAEPASVKLGSARLPPGQVREDEFFGRVETYRDAVLIRIPVKLPAGAEQFTLVARSQGCADAGVCYTPQQQQVVLGPGAGEASPRKPPASSGKALLDALGADPAPTSR
jgi:thiol:disulfide interchange protein DsbD